MKVAEFRAKTVAQLNELVLELRREQFNLRFRRATGQNEGTSRMRVIRRDIARALTVVTEQRRKARAASEPRRPSAES